MSTHHFRPASLPAALQNGVHPSEAAHTDRPDAEETGNSLVVEHLNLVNNVLRRLLPRLPAAIDSADVWSAGVVGLIEASRKYDASRAIKFRTYAESRVRGAMFDYLRSLTWAPRAMYGRARQLRAAQSVVEHRNGRAATISDLAEEMGLSIQQQHNLLANVGRLQFADIEAMFDQESVSALDLPTTDKPSDPLCVLERNELLDVLAQAIDHLPERQKHLLWLYYYEEMTMKQIGATLNVNEARVSQLHSKSIATLRREIQKILNGEDAEDPRTSHLERDQKAPGRLPRASLRRAV
ncbi:MAG TPA: FliA/WhiG family RNA polymerase sigma factor [Blastocatellia bacterium]|nr:FliA/WhiG family RNA polymerase sigma factor [Blastocatellia bacterium]